jgi:predicted nucleotidyltransferase
MKSIDWIPEHRDLTRQDRDLILLNLKTKLAGRVLEAFVFGSFASNTHGPDSDIDLVLVKNTTENFIDRNREFIDLFDVYSAMDILVYTPNEFLKKCSEEDGFFKNQVLIRVI